MELKKQDIGVWVKASEELPKVSEEFWIKVDNKRVLTGTPYKGRFMSQEGVHPNSTVEWLKPIEQVYVLTEDELIQLLKEFPQNVDLNFPKQFIKSITK